MESEGVGPMVDVPLPTWRLEGRSKSETSPERKEGKQSERRRGEKSGGEKTGEGATGSGKKEQQPETKEALAHFLPLM